MFGWGFFWKTKRSNTKPFTGEINYVLKGVYKFSSKEIDDVFHAIKEVRGITIIDGTNIDQTLIFWRKYQIKFSDCLIAGQIQKGMELVTFDEELIKIKEIVVKRPVDCGWE